MAGLVTVVDAADALPRLTAGAFFSEWSLAPLPLVITVWATGLYLLGVLSPSPPG